MAKQYRLINGGVDFECRRTIKRQWYDNDEPTGNPINIHVKWPKGVGASYADVLKIAAKKAYGNSVGNGEKIRLTSPQFDFVSFVIVDWR